MGGGDAADALSAWRLAGALTKPLGGGTANRNYLVEGGPDRFVLRCRSPRYSHPAQIAFDHAFMQHLADCGLEGPLPIPTESGGTWFDYGGNTYELHCYWPGHPFDWGDLSQLICAAQSLRRFHDAAATFIPPQRKRVPREDAPDDIAAGLADLRGVVGTPTGRAVLGALEGWSRRIAEAVPDAAFWSLPCLTVHGDVHPGNVNFAGGRMRLFDLDCASWQPRARDVADGLLYFCARRDGPFDASTIVRLTRTCWLEPARNRLFVEAYGGLTAAEEAALPWLVAARWIYSRVRGRLKLPRDQWEAYLVEGVLVPLEQLEGTGGLFGPEGTA